MIRDRRDEELMLDGHGESDVSSADDAHRGCNDRVLRTIDVQARVAYSSLISFGGRALVLITFLVRTYLIGGGSCLICDTQVSRHCMDSPRAEPWCAIHGAWEQILID